MTKQNNPAIGRDAIEFMNSLLSPEETAASDRRVAIVGRLIKARDDTLSALCDYVDVIEPDEQIRRAVKEVIASKVHKAGQIFDVEKVEAMCRAKRRKLL